MQSKAKMRTVLKFCNNYSFMHMVYSVLEPTDQFCNIQKTSE